MKQVQLFPTRDDVVRGVGEQLVEQLDEILEQTGDEPVNLVLTGGSVGIDILRVVAEHPRAAALPWERIHLWWGDERWLPAGDAERNDEQAREAFISKVPVPPENVHRFPASDGGLALDEAAAAYEQKLAEHAATDGSLPRFDLLLLGVGPDGHIASLFPDRPELLDALGTVVAVRDSPKPPPERLSLTLSAINSADRIWLALAGADKASALGLALAGANLYEVPVAAAEATGATIFFVDQAAAAEVPAELLSPED